MGNIATHHILKLNQSPYTMQSTSSLPSPNLFNQILPNLCHSLIAKLNEAFPPPETLARWLEDATPHMNEALGIVLLSLVCWCCLPVIIGCISLLAAVCWSLITGLFGLLRGMCKGFFNVFFWCGRSLKLMKAPGRGGRVIMPRDSFESDPRGYFRNLRAGKSAGKRKAERIGMGAGIVAGVAMLASGVLKLFGA